MIYRMAVRQLENAKQTAFIAFMKYYYMQIDEHDDYVMSFQQMMLKIIFLFMER